MTQIYNSSYAIREDATFQCVTNSSQDISSVQWFKASTQLSNSSKYIITGNTGSSLLTIFNVTSSDIDAYACNASTTNRSEAKTAYLDVVGKLQCLFRLYCMVDDLIQFTFVMNINA